MRQRSVMKHQFSQVPKVEIPRSSFNRSHGLKTAFNAGFLTPVYVDEALPGDTFNMRMTAFARMATPLHPTMDNLFMDVHFFSVPNRLLWENWQRFNGEQDNPSDSIDFTVPIMDAFTPAEGGLADYFGLPWVSHTPNALHFRAYNLIWNDWYRDENLQDSAPINTDDGPDEIIDYTQRRRGKRHDYFTSALPWPQKGGAVPIPVSGNPVAIGPDRTTPGGTDLIRVQDPSLTVHALNATVGTTNFDLLTNAVNGGTIRWADATGLTGSALGAMGTINQLRQAFQIQKLLERDARGGTRYIEIIKSHFGVTSPDARLQRPEFLGGGTTAININPIAQTSEGGIGANTPQGNLAGVGTATMHNAGFVHSFTEHCVVIGLASVRADLTYQQGLNRMWSRQTRYDYYWPTLAHIGEQEVLNQEIFMQGSFNPVDQEAFGYQERYAEYRYKPSVITGAMRSAAAQSLDTWHLSQDFASLPTLGNVFIQETPPMDRILAVPAEPDFLLDAHFQLRCARPMPLYGVPGMIDRF